MQVPKTYPRQKFGFTQTVLHSMSTWPEHQNTNFFFVRFWALEHPLAADRSVKSIHLDWHTHVVSHVQSARGR